MRNPAALLALVFGLCFTCSCSSTATPFGQSNKLGTNTTGYIAARGDVNITLPNGNTLRAGELLIVDNEDNAQAFDRAMGMAQTITRWAYGAKMVGTLSKAASSVMKSKEITARQANAEAGLTQRALSADKVAVETFVPPEAAVAPAP